MEAIDIRGLRSHLMNRIHKEAKISKKKKKRKHKAAGKKLSKTAKSKKMKEIIKSAKKYKKKHPGSEWKTCLKHAWSKYKK